MKIRITEGRLREMIREAVDEAFNTDQYAAASGYANQLANSWRAKFDPKYRKRKERQAKLFGNAATGMAPSQSYMNNDEHGMGGAAYQTPNSAYDIDMYRNNYNDGNADDNGDVFNIRHSQFNDGIVGSSVHGQNHGERMDRTGFRQAVRNNEQTPEQMNDMSGLTLSNRRLNKAYKQGQQAKKGTFRQTMRDLGQGNTERTRRGFSYEGWH